MGNGMLDIFPVGADEPAQGDIIVPNLDRTPFPKKLLHELNLRTLSQIVGRCLKAQSQNRDIALARYPAPFELPA